MKQTQGDPSKPAGENRPYLIEVKELAKYFPVRSGLKKSPQTYVKAVDGVSFNIKPGETLGLVGESGCGKTTVGRSILRLITATSGEVLFNGQDVLKANGRELKNLRRNMQIIFQDPYSSLDPRLQIAESVGLPLYVHGMKNPKERQEIVLSMLEKVGLASYHLKHYPHEFSGGQLQRVGIARALTLNPKFIVCDEPVSALDVSIESQILNLLSDLQDEFGLAYLFIAHNLSVVKHFSDRVAVMYLGKVVELADRDEIYQNHLHPYTQALMSAIPIPNPRLKRQRIILSGDVPSPLNPPSGCRFHTRCPLTKEICSQQEPEYKEASSNHWVACWNVS
jgi:peptide/nickel transport system ATP-binding protein/oligopeptide transport system ATP-binding protein